MIAGHLTKFGNGCINKQVCFKLHYEYRYYLYKIELYIINFENLLL